MKTSMIDDDSWQSIAYAIAIWSDRGSRRTGRLRAREDRKSGLRMVYGECNSDTPRAAGAIVGAGQDLQAAIRRVGKRIEAPAQLITDCIASLELRRVR